MNWFYAQNGQQQGPVSEFELSRLLSSGTISSETLIWKEGMPEWVPISSAAPELATPSDTNYSVQQMREGVTAAAVGGVKFAGFWIRFAAKFIDGILLYVVNTAIQMAAFGVANPQIVDPKTGELIPEQIGLFMTILSINMSIQIAYNTIMIGRSGATFGKMAVGIKVITADGGKVSYLRAFGRYMAEILSSITLLIGYIIAAFDSEKRALHDHIASTRVVMNR